MTFSAESARRSSSTATAAEPSATSEGGGTVVSMTTLKNRPAAVTALLLLLVIAHVVATRLWKWPSLLGWMAPNPNAWSLYAAGSAATAALAGFAGVVVVLAMADNARFAKMRIEGAESLEANWLSTVASSLLATVGLVAAATADLGGHGVASVWIAEASFLMAFHAGLRLLWLLRALVSATRGQDEANRVRERAVSYEEIASRRL